MSRCFRYHSDLARNGSSSDPLIQFIKEDGKKSKAEKKKEKRERKERRVGKRKRKTGLSNLGEYPSNKKPKLDTCPNNDDKPDNKTPKIEAVVMPVSDKGEEPRSKRRRTHVEEPPSIVPPKSALRRPKNPRQPSVPNTICFRKVEESELLEKSALTEENELPIYLPNFAYSSANSQILRKRIQPVSPVSAHPPGGSINKIRIRMQCKGLQEKAVDNRTPVCSTSGRVVGPIPYPPKQPAPTVVVRSVHEKTLTRLHPVYEALLVGCLPPLVPADPDGEDWLFGSRGCHLEKPVEKMNEVAGCCQPSDGDRIQWPRACFLPEACVHVMPYMVPY